MQRGLRILYASHIVSRGQSRVVLRWTAARILLTSNQSFERWTLLNQSWDDVRKEGVEIGRSGTMICKFKAEGKGG